MRYPFILIIATMFFVCTTFVMAVPPSPPLSEDEGYPDTQATQPMSQQPSQEAGPAESGYPRLRRSHRLTPAEWKIFSSTGKLPAN